jgi:dTDP-4-dehydrorhamnose 3,5-epimerase
MHIFKPEPKLKLSQHLYQTKIPGLFFIEHQPFYDDRGFFNELGIIPDLNKTLDLNFEIKQINLAHSKTNVVRGLHAEDWNKFIHIISGVAFCALADIRPDSETFLQVETFTLSTNLDTGLVGSLFISSGIANSVCVLQGPVNYLYHVDELYRDRNLQNDSAISLFDPDLNIEWPIDKKDMIISQRDHNAITLREKFPNKFD